MKRFVAIGERVPRQISGAVTSIHTQVINILIDDGLFLSLVASPVDMTARALLLERGELPGGVAPGDPVTGDINAINIEGTPPLHRYAAKPWSGALRGAEARISHDELWDRVRAVRDLLLREQSEIGVVGALGDAGGSLFVRSLRRKCRRGEYGGLIGLGQGFTPSGDDFLSGMALFLALHDATERGPGGDDRFSSFKTRSLRIALSRLKGRTRGTTHGGATLLALTLSESFPAYQLHVADRLLEPYSPARPESGPFEPGELVTFAGRHGESSGLDMLTGLIWASDTCLVRPV